MPALSLDKPRINVGIRASVTDTTALEVYILDQLYDSWDWDWRTGEVEEVKWVEDIITQVKAFTGSRVILYIDCSGGDAGIGLALYNFLKGYNVRVDVDVIGMAGSAASIVALAASPKRLRMARNSFMVIHKAWGYGSGSSDDLRTAADVVDKYTQQYVDIYSQRTGKSTDEIQALIANGDYWMTGSEAVAMGFADETYNDNPQFAIAARVKDLSPEYRNIPKNLISAHVAEAPEDGAPSMPEQVNNLFMDFKTKVSAFLEGFKKQPVNANAKNMAEEVANVMSEPMTALVSALQSEVEEEIKGLETKVSAAVETKLASELEPKISAALETKISAELDKKYEERFKQIETVNADLQKENEDLKKEIAEKVAGESGNAGAKGGGSGANAEVQPIGRGVKATA